MSQPLYFGGEMDAFVGSDTNVHETTLSGTFDPANCRCSIQIGPAMTLKPPAFSNVQAAWFHHELYYSPSNTSEETLFTILDNSSSVVFSITGIRSFPTATFNVYLMGVSLGTFVIGINRQTWDINVNRTAGLVQVAIGGSIQFTASPSFSGFTNMASVVMHGGSGIASSTTYWSQCFGAPTSTIGQVLKSVVEDTNGANQDFTGDVTDINELVVNDATGITSDTNGNVSTYLQAAQTSSGVILGVGTSARFNVGDTGPQNIKNVIRVGGTNYFSPNTTAGGAGFGPAQYMWLTNPATSTAWNDTSASLVEWGVEALT